MTSWRELWESGEIAKTAAGCRTIAETAKHFGTSATALDGALRRLRESGMAVPSWPDLLGRGRGPRSPASATASLVVERWDEETQPDVPVAIVDEATERHSCGSTPPGMELSGEQDEHPDPVTEHRAKRRIRELEAENKALLNRIMSAEDRLDILNEAQSVKVEPIRPREGGGGAKHEATAVFLVSDLHLEEEVRPERVNGLNRFNLEIARLRMRRLFERMRWFLDRQRADHVIRDVVVWLGGDTFTGHLHPDNVESTLLAPPAAFAFAKQLISDGLRFLLEDGEITRLVCPCNDGNHSRLTKDLRASTRADHSLETLMYGMMAQDFADDQRVQFEIAQGDRLYTEIYDHTVRWTHGAEVKGGGGIGGIMIPLYRAMSRWETERKASITVAGHFHQRISLRDLEMNGSLIGWSSYAARIGARFEEPTQSAFLIDARRGKGVSAPLWASSPEEELALWKEADRRAA